MLIFRLITLLLLTVMYSSVHAGQVSGTIKNDSGSGLAHITVTLTDQSGDQLFELTDAFGRYHFPEVAGGMYQVAFADDNFIFYVDPDPYPDEGTVYLNATWPQTVTLGENQNLDLGDFILARVEDADYRQNNSTVTDCTNYGDGQTPQTFSYALLNAKEIIVECSGTLAVPELVINKDVKITTTSDVKFIAQGYNRIIRVLPGVTFQISGIDITNGEFTDGIALLNTGTTTIENAELTGHRGNTGTIVNYGDLNLNNVRQYQNSILYDSILTNKGVILGVDVTIESHVSSAGPVLTNHGRIELRQCQIDGLATNNVWSVSNKFDSTFKLFDCTFTRSNSPFSNQGTLEIYDSAMDSNDGDQGLIETNGVLIIGGTSITNNDVYGGIVDNEGDATFINSTVSGNSTSAGLYDDDNTGAISNSGLMRITTSTITGNIHRAGSDHQLGNSGELTLSNTIISGVEGGTECSGITPIQSIGHNLHTDGTCGSPLQTDIPFGNPNLAALADNGGIGKTQALQTGSDAIDAGNCGDGATAKDQRGVSRPQGNACDIGAYELIGAAVEPEPEPTPEPEEQPVNGLGDDQTNIDTDQTETDSEQSNPDDSQTNTNNDQTTSDDDLQNADDTTNSSQTVTEDSNNTVDADTTEDEADTGPENPATPAINSTESDGGGAFSLNVYLLALLLLVTIGRRRLHLTHPRFSL